MNTETDAGGRTVEGKENDEAKHLEDREEEECRRVDKSTVGLDTGYAWVIVIGHFITMIIGAGFMKSAGIFFLQFQGHYSIGAMQAAWPGAIMSLVLSGTGPLVSAVCNRYSVRTALMMGTTMVFVGLVLNSIVDNFYFLFFCHSLIQGAGINFMITPGLFLLSSYFDKRRGFACSLSSAGVGVGTFLMVALVNFLFSVYGFKGSFLILSGILANGYVVAMLFRPLRDHQKYLLMLKKKRDRTLWSDKYIMEDGDNSGIPLQETTVMETDDFVTVNALEHTANDEQHQHLHYKTSDNCCNYQESPSAKCSTTINPVTTTKTRKETHRQATPTSCYLEFKSCLKICFPADHERKGNNTKRKIFDFALLKDLSFLLYLFGTVLFTMVLKAMFTFVPAACVDKGLTKADAALVLSIGGAVDTFARLGIGYSLDLPRLKPYRTLFFIGFLFGLGLTGLCVPFLESFESLVVICSLIFLHLGAHMSQRPVVLVDLLGKELLPSCMGLTQVFQAIGVLTGPLIFGLIRDVTGSYDSAFYVGSSLAFLAGILLILSNIVLRRKRSQQQQRQQRHEQQQQRPD